AAQGEEDVADDVHLDGIAENILGVELLGQFVRNEAGGEVVGFVHGEPVQSGKTFQQGAVLVFEADRETIAAGVDIEGEIAQDDAILRIVWAKIGGFDGLTVDGGSDAGMDVNGGLAGMKIEGAGLCRY